MLSKDEARELVEYDLPKDGAVCHESAHWFGWVFGYQSKEYLESRDPLDMWVGNGPIIVNKYSGNVYKFRSYPTNWFIWKYGLTWIFTVEGLSFARELGTRWRA